MNTQFRLGKPSQEFVDWMFKKNTKRPYKFFSAEMEKYSLETHREEDERVEKKMKMSAPKRVDLDDLKEDREEEDPWSNLHVP